MTTSTHEYHLKIRDLPSDERPRERLINYGAEALSNAELLAILLRIGGKGENVLSLSTRVLVEKDGLLGLAKASINDLSEIKGIGLAKCCQLKAALELGRRLLITSPEGRPRVNSPQDVANLLMLEMGQLEQEHLRVLLLDTKNHITASPTVYIGNVNTAVIRVSEVFREAVRENSTAMIIVHNHPTGDPTPSPEDVQVTKRFIEAGQMLDIEVLDHIIIGQQCYLSLKEKGLAFE